MNRMSQAQMNLAQTNEAQTNGVGDAADMRRDNSMTGIRTVPGQAVERVADQLRQRGEGTDH